MGRGDLFRPRPVPQGRGAPRLLSQMSRSHADSCVSVPGAVVRLERFSAVAPGAACVCGTAAPHGSKGLGPLFAVHFGSPCVHSGPRDALAPVWAAPSATCTAQPRTWWTPPQVGHHPARGHASWESCPTGAFGGCFMIFLRSIFVIYSIICLCQPQNTLGN